jgi:hypothetical protein
VLFEEIDEVELRPVPGVALNQVEAEPRQLAPGTTALDRHLGDRGGMEPSRQFLFDDGALADTEVVHDELARHDAEDDLLAAFERDERPLARFDGGLADLAAWRIRVELLDGAPEEDQEFLHRRRVREPGRRRRRRDLDRRTRATRTGTAAAQPCQLAIRNVIACARVNRHGLSFSLADTQLNANEPSDLAWSPAPRSERPCAVAAQHLHATGQEARRECSPAAHWLVPSSRFRESWA